jgi:signal transduction histidine kinase/CheY-like chemotaxis protein
MIDPKMRDASQDDGLSKNAIADKMQRLEAEVIKLRKINQVLMDRVERDIDGQGVNAFALFQTAITLENKVCERTADLTELTHQLLHQISERRTAEQALQLAKAEADEANVSKTRFLAAASHDLHQPLNAARLFLASLAEEVSGARAEKLVENIGATLDNVEDLLRTLLDISRLDAGVWPVEIEEFSVAALYERLRREYEPQAWEKGLRFRVRSIHAVVRGDRVLFERLLRNLISNALRYTETGSILLACRKKSRKVRFEVWDTGVGIPNDKLEQIFEEFQQLGIRSCGREKGLGLGLAIVRRIARLLDSTIHVASVLGRGSVFSIVLPEGSAIDDVKREVFAQVPNVLAPDALLPNILMGRCIGLIDNDETVLRAMDALLRSWGCVTIVARSAPAAMNCLETAERLPELVIADYRLDDAALGTDAVAILRERLGAHVPALIITGEHSKELRAQVMELGMSFLGKPVSPMKLRAVLAHLLSQRCS